METKCFNKAIDEYINYIDKYVVRGLISLAILAGIALVLVVIGIILFVIWTGIFGGLNSFDEEGGYISLIVGFILGMVFLLGMGVVLITIGAALLKHYVIGEKSIGEAFKTLAPRHFITVGLALVAYWLIIAPLGLIAFLVALTIPQLAQVIVIITSLLISLLGIPFSMYLIYLYDKEGPLTIIRKAISFITKEPVEAVVLWLLGLVNNYVLGLGTPLLLLIVKYYEEGRCKEDVGVHESSS